MATESLTKQQQSCHPLQMRLSLLMLLTCCSLGVRNYKTVTMPQLIAGRNDLPQPERNQTTLVVYLYADEDSESIENFRFFLDNGIRSDHTADYLVVLLPAAQVHLRDLSFNQQHHTTYRHTLSRVCILSSCRQSTCQRCQMLAPGISVSVPHTATAKQAFMLGSYSRRQSSTSTSSS
jgi:hypothetical protein